MRYSSFSDINAEARKNCRPTFAYFEITYRCNIRCVHCYVCPNSREAELSFKEITSVLKQLAAAGVLFLDLSGGEPLIRKDFFEIAKYARNLGFALGIVTNATLITKQVADNISELSPRLVKVSLYGPSEKTFGKITGQPNLFHRAIEGIHLLAERDVPLRINYNIFKFHTREDVIMVKKIAKSCNAFLKINISIEPRRDGSLGSLKYALPKSRYTEFYKIFPEILPLTWIKKPNMDELVCNGTRIRIHINPYGYVGHCYAPLSRDNVRNKPLMEILKKDPLLKAQRELRWRDIFKHNRCTGCKNLYNYCSDQFGVCSAYNFSFNKSLVKIPKTFCYGRENMRILSEKFKRKVLPENTLTLCCAED